MMLARVVILGAVGTLERLVYAVPAPIAGHLSPGHRVLVPLRSRRVTAIVTELGDNLDSGGAVPKPIIEVLEGRPLFDSAHLQLVEFLAGYYMVPIGEGFRSVLPSLARIESRRVLQVARNPDPLAQAAFTPAEREIIDALTKRPMTVAQLERRCQSNDVKAAIMRWMAAGWITAREATRGRHRKSSEVRPAEVTRIGPQYGEKTGSAAIETPDLQLTSEQAAAIAAVTPTVRQRHFEPFLLWGVTASGKSEVYMRLASEALAAHRQVLVLVPEIALADQLVGSFRSRFGTLVAVAHSAQNISERWASWMAAMSGEARIMIGPRSAIFAPINDLGLIVVDEEHDGAYKQEEGIRYNARDLAVVLARLASCPIVLGSATPSAESYANGRGRRYRLLQLSERVPQRKFATVEIIDLRQHAATLAKLPLNGQISETSEAARSVSFRTGRPASAKPVLYCPKRETSESSIKERSSPLLDQVPLAQPLIDALAGNLAAAGQSLVFLNRRGYHNFLQCHGCGSVITCRSCSVSMTFHLRGRLLRCHYCGASEPAPGKCFECGAFDLAGQGYGTERLVQALAAFFPSARIERMDSDTSGRRGARSAILHGVRSGEVDILVGTQMITKGFDFQNVTLVGVVLADLSLNMPDFRAAERTFQLLTQAAGRAGRGERPGRVLIQTYAPHHYSIRAARDQDYPRFIRREMELRRELMYPPFARMALVRIEGGDPSGVSERASKIAALLSKVAEPGMRVLGPAPAPIEKIKQRYRWQVLVKSRERHALRAALSAIIPYRARGDIAVSIDMDPVNML